MHPIIVSAPAGGEPLSNGLLRSSIAIENARVHFACDLPPSRLPEFPELADVADGSHRVFDESGAASI
jgi:hypothetical protein